MSYFRSISFRVTFWVSLVVVVLVSVHIYQIRPEKRFLEQKMGESERIARIIEHHLLAEMSAGEPDNIQEHLENPFDRHLRVKEGISVSFVHLRY